MSYLATNGIGDMVNAAIAIGSDPYLNQVAGLVLELKSIESGSTLAVAQQVATSGGGVGLKHIVKPLEAWVYARKHPWVLPVGAGLLLGIPLLIGYTLGKKKR